MTLSRYQFLKSLAEKKDLLAAQLRELATLLEGAPPPPRVHAGTPWEKWEEILLKKASIEGRYFSEIMNLFPQRTEAGVRKKMSLMDLRLINHELKPSAWTEKELAILKENFYAHKLISEYVHLLPGRSVLAIRWKKDNLGLKNKNRPPLKKYISVPNYAQEKSEITVENINAKNC